MQSSPAALGPRIGDRIGDRYEIERSLGVGGMSTVFCARDVETGKTVAVKWLGKLGASPSDRDLARFEQEARIAASLTSPHIGRVIDVGRDPKSGVPYLVMDLLPGEDLQTRMNRVGALPTDTAVRIAKQACAGLAAAHAAAVVHRDVKPSNLFLIHREGEVRVVVMDFGIAKIRRDTGLPKAMKAPLESMTNNEDVLGSPLYMSPEQVDSSRRVDARSDVFSMGVTMYAMLTGRAPYAHIPSLVKLLYHIVNYPAPPLATAAPWVSADVAAIVDRAMSHDLEQRYPDAQALGAALEACSPGDTALREEMLVGADRPLPPTGDRAPEAATQVEEEGTATRFWRGILARFR